MTLKRFEYSISSKSVKIESKNLHCIDPINSIRLFDKWSTNNVRYLYLPNYQWNTCFSCCHNNVVKIWMKVDNYKNLQWIESSHCVILSNYLPGFELVYAGIIITNRKRFHFCAKHDQFRLNISRFHFSWSMSQFYSARRWFSYLLTNKRPA